MDTLEEKYDVYRDVILSELEVSDDFMRLMMEKNLVDSRESSRFKAIEDKRTQNEELMSAMIERRTDRAYPILLECLRESEQGKIADLLTDVTETDKVAKGDNSDSSPSALRKKEPTPAPPPIPSEMDPIREVNANLEALLEDLKPYLSREERRIGLETTAATEEQDAKSEPVHDNEEQNLEAESQQAERQLLQSVKNNMVSAITEIGRCQTIIQKLHVDCQSVADVNSEIMAQIKDCDNSIREMLRTHRMPVSKMEAPQRTSEFFQMLMEDVRILSDGRQRVIQRDMDTRSQSMRLLRTCRDRLDERCQNLNHLHHVVNSRLSFIYPPPSSTRLTASTPMSLTSQTTSRHGLSPAVSRLGFSRQGDLPSLATETQPIGTVLEGLGQLEHQIKEYIHLETFLTEKLKADIKIKQLQKKAQGYTSKGFLSVKQHLDEIEQGVEVEQNVDRVKGVLVKLTDEYDQCVQYMRRVTAKMANIAEPDTARNPEPQKPDPKQKGKDKKKKGKEQVPPLRLPQLVPEHTFSKLDSGGSVRGKPLLHRLKTLAANYEATKKNETEMEQRFRLDWDRKKKEMLDVIRKKDEEILNIHFRLKEMMADRDKFRKLYEQAKASVGRKG